MFYLKLLLDLYRIKNMTGIAHPTASSSVQHTKDICKRYLVIFTNQDWTPI